MKFAGSPFAPQVTRSLAQMLRKERENADVQSSLDSYCSFGFIRLRQIVTTQMIFG